MVAGGLTSGLLASSKTVGVAEVRTDEVHVPGSDDTGMLVTASVLKPGTPHDVGLLYRKWRGQMTASAAHSEPIE